MEKDCVKEYPKSVIKFYPSTWYSFDAFMNSYLYVSHPHSLNDMQDSNVVYQQTTPYVLTEVEHDLVMRSEEDYKAGRIYTQAEVDKLVATWLH